MHISWWYPGNKVTNFKKVCVQVNNIWVVHSHSLFIHCAYVCTTLLTLENNDLTYNVSQDMVIIKIWYNTGSLIMKNYY